MTGRKWFATPGFPDASPDADGPSAETDRVITRAFFYHSQAVHIELRGHGDRWGWTWAAGDEARGRSIECGDASPELAHAAAKLDVMHHIGPARQDAGTHH